MVGEAEEGAGGHRTRLRWCAEKRGDHRWDNRDAATMELACILSILNCLEHERRTASSRSKVTCSAKPVVVDQAALQPEEWEPKLYRYFWESRESCTLALSPNEPVVKPSTLSAAGFVCWYSPFDSLSPVSANSSTADSLLSCTTSSAQLQVHTRAHHPSVLKSPPARRVESFRLLAAIEAASNKALR